MKSNLGLIKGLVLSFLAVTSFEALAGNKVSAKVANVDVYTDANKTSAVLQQLKKGQTLEAKERKGMFWEVVLEGGKPGFVSIMQVSKAQGDGDASVSAALAAEVQKQRNEEDSSNIRARSAVMGVRGLAASDDTAFAGNAKPNMRMVYNMENFLLPHSQIDDLSKLVEKEIQAKMN